MSDRYWAIQWSIAVVDNRERKALAAGDKARAASAANRQRALLAEQAQIRKQMGARHA